MKQEANMGMGKTRSRLPFAAAMLVGLTAASALAIEIPEGTHVLMRLENTVTTRTAQPGDKVYLRTASPILAGDRVAVPANCFATATVTTVKRGGRVKGRAELGLRLDTLVLPSGKAVSLAGRPGSVDAGGSAQTADKEGMIRQGSDGGRDAAITASRTAQGAALGAIVDRSARGAGIGAGAGGAAGLAQVLLTRGRDVELRRGSTIDVVLDRRLNVE
jgi:type IV secretion system protein VirB10